MPVNSDYKILKKLSRKVGLTIREHNLLEEKDRLMMALSGGKDSMILLEILADRIKAFPFHVKLFAVHVTPENIGYHVNIEYLQNFCKDLGVELFLKSTQPELENSNKAPCFICSWERRKVIFELAKELNCNKLAFGHHRDDALQTFMMNLLYHGSISSMPYKLKMFKGQIQLIRPMLDLWEKELFSYSKLKSFASIEKDCPYDEKTQRNYVAGVLEQLEKDFPQAKFNMFKALDNICDEYLPESKLRSKKNLGKIV